MADLFSMKAPLVIRFPNGEKRIMAEYFRHPKGLLFFEVFWHQNTPYDAGIFLIEGEYKGDGPWKIGECVVSVLGCHGTDPNLANLYAEWQFFLQTSADEYPVQSMIKHYAKARGAIV
jgi:hypothetical protein